MDKEEAAPPTVTIKAKIEVVREIREALTPTQVEIFEKTYIDIGVMPSYTSLCSPQTADEKIPMLWLGSRHITFTWWMFSVVRVVIISPTIGNLPPTKPLSETYGECLLEYF
ncbi:hypothetical protein Tco_0878819 [Tanacetum coccineum]|uniref:Uncharacterized protein n=1 Tax=Tanacetum coccineum TaxID=301880 RepID=A0ABQ5C254_9ASTR